MESDNKCDDCSHDCECNAYMEMNKWGKDHTSLLAYIVHCCWNNNGKLSPDRIRVNSSVHPGFKKRFPVHVEWDNEWGTRIKDNEVIGWHDDVHCFEDLERAGLVTNAGTGINIVASMTDLGFKVADALFRHKCNDGTFGSFNYSEFLCETEQQ